MLSTDNAPEWRTPKRRKPVSLFRFLTDRGGLRPCGDLRYNLDGKFGWMIRKSGMTLDGAREACVEAGYLQDPAAYTGNVSDSTINDLLELIDAEARGFKQYPWGEWPEPDDSGEPVGADSPAATGSTRACEGTRESTMATMTAAQYRKALDKLNLTIVGAAPYIGLSRRQAQRIAAGESPVPEPVAKLLRLLVAGKITLDDLG